MPNPLTKEKEQFIFDNVGKMKQKHIAQALGITPACVNQKIKGRRKTLTNNTEIFNIDNEAGMWKTLYN